MKEICIKGYQGTSLLDFPGRVASLVFTGGCNLTCPFCHNGGLVLDPVSYPDFPLDELLADLKKRNCFIDGVVVSGGEPTIDSGLPAFLRQLKGMDLQVKLDTNGLVPDVVADLLEEGLLDYIAVDLKTGLKRYGELHTHPVDTSTLQRTIELLQEAEVETEYRTTCIPHLVGRAEVEELGSLIEGAPLWVFQQYVPSLAMIEEWQEFEAYPPDQLQLLASQAEQYVEQVQIRGI